MIIGLSTPANIFAKGPEVVKCMQRSLLDCFRQARDTSHNQNSSDNINAVDLFRQLQAVEERTELVIMALSKKLARALSIKPEDIDEGLPLHAFGVDSLGAVELRNWIARDSAADIPLFDIAGGRTIAATGDLTTT